MNAWSEKVQIARSCNALRIVMLAATLIFPAASKTLVSSTANALNRFGFIVGARCYDDSNCRATLWYRDFVFDLGVLPNGSSSVATGINNFGQIVGYSNTTAGPLSATPVHAFLWSLGSIQDLGVLNPGDESSRATGINDAGQVVGSSCKPVPPLTEPACLAFVYRNGKLNSLDLLPGGSTSWAVAINTMGEIVGYGDTPPPSPPYPPDFEHAIHGILWDPNGTVAHDFGLGPPVRTIPYGLNDGGSVVGSVADFAFLLTNGVLGATLEIPIGAGTSHCVATDVNNINQVVGFCTGDHPTLAFLWQNGAATLLLPPPPLSAAMNSMALAINNAGLVVGSVRDQGLQVAAIWENGTVSLLKQ